MTRTLMLVVFAISFCTFLLSQFVQAQIPGATPAQAAAAKVFRAYLDADWNRWMELYPELATSVGYPGQNRRWSDDSPQGIEARKAHLTDSLKKLKSFSREALSTSEQLNYDLYRELLETAEEGLQYGDDPMPFRNVVPGNFWLPLNQMGGVQQGAAEALSTQPRQSVSDYEDILARLEGLPKRVEEQIALLEEGVGKGFTQPRIAMRDVPKQIADLVPEDPMKSALLEAFTGFPPSVSEADRTRLTARAAKIYSSNVRPAFLKLHDYLA